MHGTHADTMDWSLLVPVEFQGAKNLEIPTVLPCQGFISDNNWHNTARIGDTLQLTLRFRVRTSSAPKVAHGMHIPI